MFGSVDVVHVQEFHGHVKGTCFPGLLLPPDGKGDRIAYGALGGLIASLLTFITLWAFDNEFSINLIANEHFLWYGAIALVLVLFGILISYLSTTITVRLYIHNS